MPQWLPRAAAIGGCAYFLIHSLSIVLGPKQRVMEWLYDDTFYYMITAKHLSEQHIASFDGVTVTSGYHPLWMWLCAILYGLRGRLDFTYVRCCMGLALCISGGMLCATLRYAIVKRQRGLLWALGLAATSYSALNNGLTVMEWPLVVLCWLILHHFVMSREASEQLKCSQAKAYVTAFWVGFAGSLSRTDFGLIPLCYLAASLIVLRAGQWNSVRRAGTALAGSVVGLALVLIYNFRMTGSWFQASAETKRIFASLSSPFNPVPALWQFLRVVFYLPPLELSPALRTLWLLQGLRLLLVIGLLTMAFFVGTRKWLYARAVREWKRRYSEDLASVAAVLGLTSYLLVYALNSQATYGWYTATITGFVLVLASRVLGSLRGPVAARIVLPLMLCNVAVAEYCGGNARGQTQEIAIGKRMHAEHPGARMGGGDVGKPSFYNDGTMFNLDGLMNNEVYPYLIAGRIHCYILHRHIEYLSNVGSITVPLTDAERLKHHESPIPWSRYFVPQDSSDNFQNFDSYLKTDFDAIRSSGECNNAGTTGQFQSDGSLK